MNDGRWFLLLSLLSIACALTAAVQSERADSTRDDAEGTSRTNQRGRRPVAVRLLDGASIGSFAALFSGLFSRYRNGRPDWESALAFGSGMFVTICVLELVVWPVLRRWRHGA